nr:hypothetical protein [Coxiella-like endosymbiont of Rhipicephalus sanguineus]
MDSAESTQKLRSKFELLNILPQEITMSDFSDWGLDGSSTYQATGNGSDLILKPVHP